MRARSRGCGTVGEAEALLDRRRFLERAGGGLGLLALQVLAGEAAAQGTARPADGPLAPKTGPLPARAKRVISIFLPGGMSHVDSFDPKPALAARSGAAHRGDRKLLGSPWETRRFGKSGLELTSLFPLLGQHADRLAVVRSVVARDGNHTPAIYQMHTGSPLAGRASVGAWVTYGLGTLNQSLPGFVVLGDPSGPPDGGPQNWGSGFLPALYQGTPFRSSGSPVDHLHPPPGADSRREAARRGLIDLFNRRFAGRHPGEPELDARARTYELAARMQLHARDVVDLADEPGYIRALYGLDDDATREMGQRCLLAARLAYKGVRFVQVYAGRGAAWDAHDDLKENHERNARGLDRGVSALLTDLSESGLLGETVVLFHTEFGRTPTSQNSTGRDHHTSGFSVWLAGGGVKGGTAYGATDELGEKVVKDPVEVADLHATLLRLLGLDHEKLTADRGGRRERLTENRGRVLQALLA